MSKHIDAIVKITQTSQAEAALNDAITKLRQAGAHYEQAGLHFIALRMRETAAGLKEFTS